MLYVGKSNFYTPFFKLTISFVILGIANSCTLNSNVKCLKNCLGGPSLTYNEPTAVFELNSSTITLKPHWVLDDPILSCSISPSLPRGLELDSQCHIKGTPTEAFPPQDYTVTASSAAGARSAVLKLRVDRGAEVLSVNSYLSLTQNEAANQVLSILGSDGNSVCRISPSLPGGLKLSPACILSGSASVASSAKDYVLTYKNGPLDRRELTRISILSAQDASLKFLIDARKIDGTTPAPQLSCTAGIDLTVKDLSPFGNDAILQSYAGCTKWGDGAGTRDNPYTMGALNYFGLTTKYNADYGFQFKSGTFILYFNQILGNSYIRYKYGNPSWWHFSPFGWGLAFLGMSYTNDSSDYTFRYFDLTLPVDSWLPSLGWHQLAYAVDRDNESFKIYLDGQIVASSSSQLLHHIPLVDQLSIDGYGTYISKLAIYDRLFSDTDIQNHCLDHAVLYGSLHCQDNSTAGIKLTFQDNAPFLLQNHCHRLNWQTVDFAGRSVLPNSAVEFLLSSGQGQFFSDSDCRISSSSLKIDPESSGQGTLYFLTSGVVPVQLTTTKKSQVSRTYTSSPIDTRPPATTLTMNANTNDCHTNPSSIQILDNFGGINSETIVFDIYEGTTLLNSVSWPAFSQSATFIDPMMQIYGKTVTVRDRSGRFPEQVVNVPTGGGCGGGD